MQVKKQSLPIVIPACPEPLSQDKLQSQKRLQDPGQARMTEKKSFDRIFRNMGVRNVISHFIFMFLFFYLFSQLFCPKANAVGFSLGVYPPIIQADLLPNDVVDNKITLYNESDDPIDLKILIQPFKPSDKENGQVSFITQLEKSNQKDFLDKNVEIDNESGDRINEILLSPKQQKSLNLHISIDKDQAARDYYFSVIFVSKDNFIDNTNQSALSAGISTNVLLSIGPKGNPQGYINTFSGPSLLQSGPVKFNVKLTNQSKFFIQPLGQILITNIFGQIVGKVNLLPVNILADSSRYLPDSSGRSLTDAIWPERFLLGPYTATLTLALSDKGPLFSRTIHFFGLPWEAVLVAGLIISAIVYLVIKVRKKIKIMYK